MLAGLSEDREAARRVAFVMMRMASKLGFPAGSGADARLQAAMERPEAMTPEEEFKTALCDADTGVRPCLSKGAPAATWRRRRGRTGYGARVAVTRADVARNGLQEK